MDTLILLRDNHNDVATLPLSDAFAQAETIAGFPPLVPRKPSSSFLPQFVDAVVAADASAPAFISLGLTREVDGQVENVIIVQTLGFTDFPVQFATPVELGLQGIDAWTPPAWPAVIAGRTYFQFIARSADRQLLISFDQSKPPPVQTVKDVIASMFGL